MPRSVSALSNSKPLLGDVARRSGSESRYCSCIMLCDLDLTRLRATFGTRMYQRCREVRGSCNRRNRGTVTLKTTTQDDRNLLQSLSVPSCESSIDSEPSWSRRPGPSLLLACTYVAGPKRASAGYATKHVESHRCLFVCLHICHQPLNPDAAAAFHCM